jgi:hypothetical protein
VLDFVIKQKSAPSPCDNQCPGGGNTHAARGGWYSADRHIPGNMQTGCPGESS